jgi:outer membrane lipoprotein SlyB
MPVSRPVIRRFAGVLALISVLAAAACAPTNNAPAATDIGSQTLGYGVIVSMRPITVSAETHANLVGMLGGSPAASPAPAIEFIVREDSGSAISVVQVNQENFRPGDRVGLARGARTGIVRVVH